MQIDLKGKVVVVTGAGRGIGRSIASTFAAEGSHVVITDVKQELLDEVKADFAEKGWSGAQHLSDVRDFARSQQVVAEVVAKFGRLDVLI
ncbi:MAG: SDR family NAD(P)-dependent oxidoreductase, partial [Chthonomonadales bacterium]